MTTLTLPSTMDLPEEDRAEARKSVLRTAGYAYAQINDSVECVVLRAADGLFVTALRHQDTDKPAFLDRCDRHNY